MGSASAAGKYREGDIVTFRRYEQDNITSNGAEGIEWIVLEVQSDRILLLSRYGLDSERYHYRKESVNWDTCSLWDWLNDTFLYEAFTRSERKSILSSGTMDYGGGHVESDRGVVRPAIWVSI